MNERIRELAEQAYEQDPLMVINPKTHEPEHRISKDGVTMYHKVFNREKFAELIVLECVRYFNEDYQRDFDTLWREDLSRGIKQHFGVES